MKTVYEKIAAPAAPAAWAEMADGFLHYFTFLVKEACGRYRSACQRYEISPRELRASDAGQRCTACAHRLQMDSGGN